MKALLAWLVGVAGTVLAVPLALALVFTALVAPAAYQELQTTPCSYNTGAATATAGAWTVPIGQPYQLRSPFGRRTDPITGAPELHEGQDIVSTESTAAPILAAAAGAVTVADTAGDTGYGRYVEVDHGSGITTRYAHLDQVLVTAGRSVTSGQQLGVEGSTGHSTGPHLHFEYRRDGTAVDPVVALQAKGLTWDGTPGGPAASASDTPEITALNTAAEPGTGEGGVGFTLPEPGEPRWVSLHNPPLPVPADLKAWYDQAAAATGLPWTLLAGIGMEETEQGTNLAPHPAGAAGLMQFLPSTWAEEGRDGDGDGLADINNPADSITSAAFYLVKHGATRGPDGVRQALRVYNPRDFYLNDVLYYAHAYGAGVVIGGQAYCAVTDNGNPNLPPMTPERVQQLFAWAQARLGLPYRLGATGPDAYDCSGFVQAAFASIDISLPRTAREQRDWVAAGNGFRVQPGSERPGDLVFTDTWLGPSTVGHVILVYNPLTHTSLEEAGKGLTYYDYTRYAGHNIYEIWRVGDITDHTA